MQDGVVEKGEFVTWAIQNVVNGEMLRLLASDGAASRSPQRRNEKSPSARGTAPSTRSHGQSKRSSASRRRARDERRITSLASKAVIKSLERQTNFDVADLRVLLKVCSNLCVAPFSVVLMGIWGCVSLPDIRIPLRHTRAFEAHRLS